MGNIVKFKALDFGQCVFRHFNNWNEWKGALNGKTTWKKIPEEQNLYLAERHNDLIKI